MLHITGYDRLAEFDGTVSIDGIGLPSFSGNDGLLDNEHRWALTTSGCSEK